MPPETTTQNQWWGYRHVTGALQVKRFFDQRDLDEAKESPFVLEVSPPFPAENREDAFEKIKKYL